MTLRQQVQQQVSNLLSRPQELHAFLVSAGVARFGSRPLPVSQKSAMVFSPHQDDETIGCGGLIALKRKFNVPVSVIFLTDGRNSHMYSRLEAPQDIVQIRRQEALHALSILGVRPSHTHFLDQVDGSLRRLPPKQQHLFIEQLVQLLLRYQPEELYVPHRKDNHPDHESTYELVQAAIAQTRLQVELFQYPIWLFWESLIIFDLKLHDLKHAFRVETDLVHDQKKQAIAAYQSQHVLLPPGFLKQSLLPYELFFKDGKD